MPTQRTRIPLEVRFWKYVEKTDTCWMWRGCRTSSGYGRLQLPEQKTLRAHRLSYEFAYGEVPPNMWVLHHCDTPPCVRPEHLFLGTAADNVRDMMAKGRGKWKSGTEHGLHKHPEKAHSAKLGWEQVGELRALKGKMTHAELAKKFGISASQVYTILANKAWVQGVPPN